MIHNNDTTTKIFEKLFYFSFDLDFVANDLQRIAFLVLFCGEEQKRDNERAEQHYKRYDPRIDNTPPTPYECMNELKWFLDEYNPDAGIKIDDKYLEKKGDGKYTIVKPIEAHHVITAISKLIERIPKCIERVGIGPDKLVECFSHYSENKYHQLFQHGSIMTNIHAKLKSFIDDLEKQINNDTPLDMMCKYVNDIAAPSLKSIIMEIRSNIIILQEGGYYSKTHAIKIATTHPKSSRERGDAIRYMIDNNCVPSKSALDRIMKKAKNGQFVVDDVWNTNKGGQKRPPILLEKERFHALVEQQEQPSRADTRAKRKVMTDYEKAVDICMEKTDKEVKEYVKKRGRSVAFDKFNPNYTHHYPKRDKSAADSVKHAMYCDVISKKTEAEKKKSSAAKQKEGLQQPSRDIQMKQLKAQLKDEVPESNSPVQIPPYINDILSGLHTDYSNPNRMSKEAAESIKHILNSNLKVNDDRVFKGIKDIKAMMERDIEEALEHQKRKMPQHQKREQQKYAFLRRKHFNPVEYVEKLVSDANQREWNRVNSIRQHNKEIHVKMNKLLKEKREEQQKKQEEQQMMDKYKPQYKKIGSLVLALHPVKMAKLDENQEYKVYQFHSQPMVSPNLYAPPKLIEVCNELGLSGKRLYFSPKQFPVTNVENAGDNDTFQQLQQYIINQSSVVGNSPVVFQGTNPGCKRFGCKHAHCKFSFLVKWDQYGYYIHISKPNPTYGDHSMIDRKCVVGCEFHSHY